MSVFLFFHYLRKGNDKDKEDLLSGEYRKFMVPFISYIIRTATGKESNRDQLDSELVKDRLYRQYWLLDVIADILH